MAGVRAPAWPRGVSYESRSTMLPLNQGMSPVHRRRQCMRKGRPSAQGALTNREDT